MTSGELGSWYCLTSSWGREVTAAMAGAAKREAKARVFARGAILGFVSKKGIDKEEKVVVVMVV